MLHNSGSYGPNEAPINMGAPVNMTNIPPLNISHNLSNLGKIGQEPPETPSPHYSLPEYSTYGHPPLGISSQMNPFQNYNPIGYQPNYLVQNPTSLHDTSWQNGMLPMNLNTQVNMNPSMLNYSIPFEKRQSNSMASNEYKDLGIRKDMPINIPQVPMKPFQRVDSDNYGLYNVNHDKFNRYNQSMDLITKSNDRPLLDNDRRKSLENTVRLIENILINTTKNKDLQRQEPDKNKIAEIIETEPVKMPTEPIEIPITAAAEIIEETEQKSPDIEVPAETKDTEETVEDAEEEVEESTNEKQNNNNDKDVEKLAKEVTETEESSSESEAEDPPQVSTEHVTVKLELESDTEEPTVVVKVEELDWTDTEFMNPFQRDSNGVKREDLPISTRVIDGENSIKEARAAVRSDSTDPIHYECPHCTIVISHPKRFLVHTKWHTFGLTNIKRIEEAREKMIRRNMRKEAKIVDRMNAKEVTDIPAGKKVYSCKECGKMFCSKGSLKNHKQRFHPTRIRECKICRKTVLGWVSLRAHVATHSGETSFKCQECDKTFKYAHSLAKHRDTHLEKTIECQQCPKMFGTTAQLKTHMKVHERAQRGTTYRCSYCAKGFYEAYNLAVHERTHRNEKPFTCDICNTSFGTNSSLKRHLKVSHNSSKPYECSTCHRSFVTESIRDRHEMRQHGDPEDFKFTCDECDCRYMKLKDLQKHVYKAHPKGKRKKKAKSESE